MECIICPNCKELLNKSADFAYDCKNQHRFKIVNGILDLLPTTSDENIIGEQEHWHNVSKKGGNVVVPNPFINNKMVNDVRNNCENIVRSHLNNYNRSNGKNENSGQTILSIGEIGCGGGSAMTYLRTLQFAQVKYYGNDVSLDILVKGLKSGSRPATWQLNFIRSSANTQLFADESLDMIFSAAALHHLQLDSVFNWIPKSLKKGGILILCEPSLKNPFAKIGRKFIKGFHTPGEKPLNPSEVRRLCEKNGLRMVYEKGEHFLTGPMEYLLGIWNPPIILVKLTYCITKTLDSVVRSPSFNYMFIQAYRRL